MSLYPQFNTNNQHELIKRENTYVLDKKMVSIHTIDRNINKWPNSNNFEIELPSTLTNISSMRLTECQIPVNYYVFSNSQKNTKLLFKIKPTVRNDANMNTYLALEQRSDYNFIVTISEGKYEPNEIANELTNLMNRVVTEYLLSKNLDVSYQYFKVIYDPVTNKLLFGNSIDEFIFPFNEMIDYDSTCVNSEQFHTTESIFSQYANWGLGYYLGFEKNNYLSQPSLFVQILNSLNLSWLVPNTNAIPSNVKPKCFVMQTPLVLNLLGDSTIYMELEKYNSIDELTPYPKGNSSYPGKVNSAFAKLMLKKEELRIIDSSDSINLQATQFYPPLDTLKKMKFKFRYHDGRLVEFKNNEFNFTIAFYQLRDEISRQHIVRNNF